MMSKLKTILTNMAHDILDDCYVDDAEKMSRKDPSIVGFIDKALQALFTEIEKIIGEDESRPVPEAITPKTIFEDNARMIRNQLRVEQRKALKELIGK